MKPRETPRIEITELPDELREVFDRLLFGFPVEVTRDGRLVASLEASSLVLEGQIVAAGRRAGGSDGSGGSGGSGGSKDGDSRWSIPRPEGDVQVVATAMKLSDSARRRLAQELGEAYIVLDLNEAPASTDVLLTHPVSPQLLGALRGMFPQARIIVTEIEDPELGVSYTGAVTRMLSAGAEAYLPPRPIGAVGQELKRQLESVRPELGAATTSPSPAAGIGGRAGAAARSAARIGEAHR